MPEPYYQSGGITLYCGDNREVMPALDVAVSAVVTDPPYGLSFMGKDWDHGVPGEHFWQVIGSSMLPGAHLLAFGGTRTFHRLAVAIEDAGFEIRDTLSWLYGSGFPKSLDVGKAIDKANGKHEVDRRKFGDYIKAARLKAGLTAAEVNRRMDMPQGVGWWEGKGAGDKWDLHLPSRDTYDRLKVVLSLDDSFDYLIDWAEAEREVIGRNDRPKGWFAAQDGHDITAPATDAAREWDGWGTALKPAWEPVIMARKPFAGTVASQVLATGTGAIHVDACRIGDTGARNNGRGVHVDRPIYGEYGATERIDYGKGRWPANVLLDEDAAALLDTSVAPSTSRKGSPRKSAVPGNGYGMTHTGAEYDDSGGPSRFFKVVESDPCDSVNIAETTSSHAEPHPDSAPSDAATSGNPGETPSSDSTPRSTNETPSASNVIAESDTPKTPNIVTRFSPESAHTNTLSHNHVNSVDRLSPTDTMTTTASHLVSDSSADPATSRNTSKSVVPGDQDFAGQIRFNYCAKASRSERNAGLEGMPEKTNDWQRPTSGMSQGKNPVTGERSGITMGGRANHHPTVKPLALMHWLLTLVTPPGGIILDPFVGSGSTLVAAAQLGIPAIGIEMDPEYCEIAARRIDHALAKARQIEMVAD